MDSNQFNDIESKVGDYNVVPQKENKFVKILYALLICIGFLAIWLATELIISVIAGVLAVILHPGYNEAQLTNLLLEWSVGLTFIRSILVVVIYYLIYTLMKKSFLNKIKATLPDKASYLPTIVIGASGQYATLLGLGLIMSLLPQSWLDAFNQTNEAVEGANPILSFITVVILAPLFEEILCRGLILNTLRNVMPRWVAIVLSSAIFGVIHGNPIQFIYATVIGILLGYLYTKYESIIVPIICHLVFNLMSMINSYIGTEGETITTIIIGLIAYASVPIFIFAIVYVAIRPAKIKTTDTPSKQITFTYEPRPEYNADALAKIESELEIKNNNDNGD